MTAETLVQQRPHEVTAHIDDDYDKLTRGLEITQLIRGKSVEDIYTHKGTGHEYRWPAGINSNDLLKDDGLRILDIGCGAGAVVRQYNHRNPDTNRAYGITAYPYDMLDRSVIVGNLHYLDSFYPNDLGSVDRAISRYTFMHLADPLSVFAMMASHVKKGGLIAVDGFALRTGMRSLVAAQVITYLVRSGHFSILGRNAAAIQEEYVHRPRKGNERTSRYIPSMLLERETPESRPIELPVVYYVDQTGRWSYRTE